MEKIFTQMKNVNPTIQQAVSGFAPLEKLNEPKLLKPEVTIPLAMWDKIITPVITGYELDGQIVIIHTDRLDEYSFELDTGVARFDLLYWIKLEYGFEDNIDAENYLDSLDSKSRNELVREFALENTDRWEVVEP